MFKELILDERRLLIAQNNRPTEIKMTRPTLEALKYELLLPSEVTPPPGVPDNVYGMKIIIDPTVDGFELRGENYEHI